MPGPAHASANSSLLSSPVSCALMWPSAARRGRCCGARRTLVVGPGVAVPKSWLLGCEAGRAGLFSRPRLPSWTRLRGRVGDESLVERVADPSLQCADRFLLRLTLGKFAIVERAAR